MELDDDSDNDENNDENNDDDDDCDDCDVDNVGNDNDVGISDSSVNLNRELCLLSLTRHFPLTFIFLCPS